jgi:hypothetical protein
MIPEKETDAYSCSSNVAIQTSAQSVPSTPSWFSEVTVIAHYLGHQGVLSEISERVRFARRRFGHYDLIDFVAVLLGYAISGERTLEEYYERLQPFALAFMALFGRDHLPARSTLSRFLAALDQAPVEALRAVFLEDLFARPLEKEVQAGGLWDRQASQWRVFDVDGTRQAARQRALPCTPDLPPAHRRLEKVCAPGYTGRKRGETVRTRTTVRKNHTHQWVGTFSGASGAGNGDYRGELRQAIKAISASMQAQSLPLSQTVVRLDGQYGNGAIVADLAGLCYVMRGKDYDLLDMQGVQSRLTQPPDQQTSHPETGTCRALFDFPDLSLSPIGPHTRVIVATHPATEFPAKVGTTRGAVVYELFYTALPQRAFTPADVVALYLHRGAFECVLGDEDQEQDLDRWCSHTAWGQEFWQILAQWIWNLRLELGHVLHPTPMRMTEFASAQMDESAEAAPDPVSRPPEPAPVPYGPPQWARPSYTKGFAGADFSLQPDGTLRCPAGRPLYAQERRPERDGSLRILYAARIGHCRACPLREQCQESVTTIKARRVSAVYWPVSSPASISEEPPRAPEESSPPPIPHPVLWGDWQRRFHRRELVKLLRHQRVDVQQAELSLQAPSPPVQPLSRAERAHYRLSWEQRLARNARRSAAPDISITLFGIPDAFAASLDLRIA